MNVLTFGFRGSILGHCVLLFFDINTYYNWFDWSIEYDEQMNGIKIVLELFKMQLFVCIGSNVQDTWFASHDSYFLREAHQKLSPQEIEQLDNMSSIEDIEDM